jgi:lysozyme
MQLLTRDASIAEKVVNRLVITPINQAQFDALVSITFNIGGGAFAGSTLLKNLNGGDLAGTADQFLVWDKVTVGEVKEPSPGLANRRQAERCMFLGGC